MIPFSYLYHFTISEFYSKTEMIFRKFFGHVRQQSFDGKSQYSILPPSFLLICKKKSSIPNFFRKREGFVYEFIRYCETKQYRRKIVITPLLSLTFLDTRNDIKHRSFPLRSLSVLWDKLFLTGRRDNASPLHPWKFWIPEFLWNKESVFTNTLVTVGQNNCDEKLWYPLSHL